MTRIPDTVDVGPYRYDVIIDRAEIDAASKSEQTVLIGHCDHTACRIAIDPDLAPDMLAETLWHETMHVILDTTGLSHELGDDDGEKLIRRLSPAIVDVLQRNPSLVRYLTTSGPTPSTTSRARTRSTGPG